MSTFDRALAEASAMSSSERKTVEDVQVHLALRAQHSYDTATRLGIRPDKMRRMAKPPMVKKTYYVQKALYEAAMDRAEEREENLSDVIRRALEQYAKGKS